MLRKRLLGNSSHLIEPNVFTQWESTGTLTATRTESRINLEIVDPGAEGNDGRCFTYITDAIDLTGIDTLTYRIQLSNYDRKSNGSYICLTREKTEATTDPAKTKILFSHVGAQSVSEYNMVDVKDMDGLWYFVHLGNSSNKNGGSYRVIVYTLYTK